jgi:hypothetical protein
MVTADELEARRAAIAGAPDLAALLANLTRRGERFLATPLAIPDAKALLSSDGGICPKDGAALVFDPRSPDRHRCPTCGDVLRGARHDRAWARFAHLWLAERAAELAAAGVLGEREDLAAGAAALLRGYGERYLRYPNRDNVLGPSRLFFSTYLESVWLTSFLAAAVMLREGGALDDETEQAVATVADEAANLIGDFNEGLSNRQTWHDAALAAIAVWFEDEGLAASAIEGPTGLLLHLGDGFGPDGMWYEGENYHLFALRGLLVGSGWARTAGVDMFADPALQPFLRRALMATAQSALPDLTFPARKDSRFGVSLAQPMYCEGWEVGAGRFTAAGAEEASHEVARWLAALYERPSPDAATFDSYLHEAGEDTPRRTRANLSWWSLLEMRPSLDARAEEWRPGSAWLAGQGLAVLRHADRYASLECGPVGGGHGHADRLHLTLHAGGVHWLPDPGTGSYVSSDLFWYRSTRAHDAPMVDGASQRYADAKPEGYGSTGEWSWVRGRFESFVRTVVLGPRWIVDVLDFSAEDPHRVELPWHVQGEVAATASGIEATKGGARLAIRFAGDAELLREEGPGLPGSAGPAPYWVQRVEASGARLVAVLAPSLDAAVVRGVAVSGETIEIATPTGVDRVALLEDRVRIEGDGRRVEVPSTLEPVARRQEPLFRGDAGETLDASARWVDAAPALDGTLDGFDTEEPITLDTEDQYRRSEEPYAGAEELSATAWLNWSDDDLFVAVDVVKPELVLRRDDAPPLRLDNEPDDIHSDGVQLYLRDPEGRSHGWLVVPSPDRAPALRVRPVAGTAATAAAVSGAWTASDAGYTITLRVAIPGLAAAARRGERLGFDLVVNEMREGRERRAGQLVWTGGGGWVWLQGDRQDPARFGAIVLAH